MSTRTPPRARPGAVLPAALVAIALVALGVVAVRELAVDRGWATGSSWVTPVVDRLDGLGVSAGLVIGAVVVGIIGLLIVLSALKPARVTHLRTDVEDLWVSRAAVAALSQAVADRQRGVVSVSASPGRRRRVDVDVVAREDAADVERRITAALDEQLEGLTKVGFAVHVTEVSR